MEWDARSVRGLLLLCAACAPARGPAPAAQPAPAPAPAYQLYVANESSDIVSRVAFTPGVGLTVEKRIPVGIMIADIDGPHGIAVSPDGMYWYVSLAHGTPFGTVWKFAAGADTLVGRVQLGLFPATMATTPDGRFLFAVNFNLHGDMVPSSVSVVYTPTMTEVARPVTCAMPHGSRLNEAGTKHYSTCMMSERLIELDARTFQVSARVDVTPGREGPAAMEPPDHAGHAPAPGAAPCSPTWAQPGRGLTAASIFVACNRNAEVIELEAGSWRVTRRFRTGKGPYNLAVTPAGDRLVVTLKGDAGVMVIDLRDGRTLATIPTTRPITHGVVTSPDGRYAFVTNEAVGSTHGTLDVIDLDALERVASVDLEFQTGGIDLRVVPR